MARITKEVCLLHVTSTTLMPKSPTKTECKRRKKTTKPAARRGQDGEENTLVRSLRAQSLITMWAQTHRLTHLLCGNVAYPLACEAGNTLSSSELMQPLSPGIFLFLFSWHILPVTFILLPHGGGRGTSRAGMLAPMAVMCHWYHVLSLWFPDLHTPIHNFIAFGS